ncbi:hypothetical protein ACFQV2_02275 [Actinokineospora soli]|uniref:Uncharacterized protein n=1 Tax=Actinokineospora soli TaxID=1048753 RepID=A0ABW2TFX7_9PSEU
MLAAGVSGLAQAVFLAGGDGPPLESVTHAAVPPDEVPKDVPAPLRFGVGAWPAIAAAIVAHLLFMLGEARTPSKPTQDAPAERADRPAAPPSASKHTASTGAERERLNAQRPVQPSNRPAVQPAAHSVQPAALPPAATPTTTEPAPSASAPVEQPQRPRVQPVPSDASSSPQKDRARAAAREHLRRTGHLPTVTALMDLADVSRGTAGTALQQLREQPADLHLVTPDENLRNSS